MSLISDYLQYDPNNILLLYGAGTLLFTIAGIISLSQTIRLLKGSIEKRKGILCVNKKYYEACFTSDKAIGCMAFALDDSFDDANIIEYAKMYLSLKLATPVISVYHVSEVGFDRYVSFMNNPDNGINISA